MCPRCPRSNLFFVLWLVTRYFQALIRCDQFCRARLPKGWHPSNTVRQVRMKPASPCQFPPPFPATQQPYSTITPKGVEMVLEEGIRSFPKELAPVRFPQGSEGKLPVHPSEGGCCASEGSWAVLRCISDLADSSRDGKASFTHHQRGRFSRHA